METAYRVSPLRSSDPVRLGDYPLVGRLGIGGMGIVYLGEYDGRYVAIKVIHTALASDPEFGARFRSEVRRAQQVPSFCTARFLTADLDNDPPYLVTEYIDGPSLEEVVAERGPLRGGALQSLAVGVATALAGIHGAGVIHRDLKPGNVLLPSGSTKVIDFGIARPVDATSSLTSANVMVGTVSYMAPERLSAERTATVSAAADVWAWGCVVAYAGAGHTPFEGDTPSAIAARILTQPPVLAGLPASLVDVVRRALAKEPADRPTAQELLALLVDPGNDAAASRTGTGIVGASVALGAEQTPDDSASDDAAPVSGVPVSGALTTGEPTSDQEPATPEPEAPVSGLPAGEDLWKTVPLVSGDEGELHNGPPPAAQSGRHRRAMVVVAVAVGVLLIAGIGAVDYFNGNLGGAAPARAAADGARLTPSTAGSPSASSSARATASPSSSPSRTRHAPAKLPEKPVEAASRVPAAPPRSASAKGVPAGGTGETRSVATGLCLDSDNQGSVYVNNQRGGNAFVDTCGAKSSQEWSEESLGGSNYHLVDQQTGLCMDGDSSGNLYTTPCYSDDNNQRWQRVVVGHSGGYELVGYRNGLTGRCLAVPAGTSTLKGETCSTSSMSQSMLFTRR